MNIRKMNKILGCLMLSAVTSSAFGQGSTVSPYSQFGLGEMAPQGVGVNRAMNGLGIGLHRGYQVNPLNPASYASIDSLTMLFDMGVSGQITSFDENGVKRNANTANFDYVIGSFRAWKHVGIALGVLPLTNVGYKYYSKSTTETMTYEGEGGLHQLFLGIGVRPFKPLSLGVNVSYLWGGFDRTVTPSTSSSSGKVLSKRYVADVNNYSLDFGLQYDIRLSKQDVLTLGLTYGLGHKLKADVDRLIVSTDVSLSTADTTKITVSNALELPHTFGAGFTFSHGAQWLVGADAQMQRWSKTSIPGDINEGYGLRSDLLKDSYRLSVGGEYCHRWNSRNFFHRIRYRIGAGYATPYYKINGQDGPKQLSASLGFGIPIMNSYNNRSFLNISAQWVNASADGLIKENAFRINIGLTFNERWFAKWKVE